MVLLRLRYWPAAVRLGMQDPRDLVNVRGCRVGAGGLVYFLPVINELRSKSPSSANQKPGPAPPGRRQSAVAYS